MARMTTSWTKHEDRIGLCCLLTVFYKVFKEVKMLVFFIITYKEKEILQTSNKFATITMPKVTY